MKRVAIDSGRLDAFIGGMPQDTLSELRRAAADRFKARGFPDPSMEDWKYTPMTRAASMTGRQLIPAEFMSSTASPIDTSHAVVFGGPSTHS